MIVLIIKNLLLIFFLLSDEVDDNFASDDLEVKVEQVEFDGDETVTDADEELLSSYHHFDHSTNSKVYSDEEDNEIKQDPLQLDDDYDDSAFCIIPYSQKEQKSVQAKKQKSTKTRSKSSQYKNNLFHSYFYT